MRLVPLRLAAMLAIAAPFAFAVLSGSAFAEPVVFTYAPGPGVAAGSVSVRGSFNGWGETPMARGADGVWSVTVELDAGEHLYKFFVDGQWPADMAIGLNGGPLDPAADDYVDDGYGGRNAVRIVGGDAGSAGRGDDAATIAPAPARREGFARIHYHRPDGRYAGWGLHVWEDAGVAVAWDQPLIPDGRDAYGSYWDVPLRDDAARLGFLIHHGDAKDPGADQFLDLANGMSEVWIVSGRETLFPEAPDVAALPSGDLNLRRAHWIDPGIIVWPGAPADAESHRLHAIATGSLALESGGVVGGESFALSRALRRVDPNGRFPHLAGAPAFALPPEAIERAGELLRGHVAVSATRADGTVAGATGLQIPGVLDALYATDDPLGVTWRDRKPTLSVWAPTAQRVRLLLFTSPRANDPSEILDMEEDRGVWSVSGPVSWTGRYYLYEVAVFAPTTGRLEVNRVTDPYSRSLATNSTRSQIVDLDAPSVAAPEDWKARPMPAPAAPEDIVLYELHIRDFSAFDESVPEPWRGRYLAFTQSDGHGMRHLRSLAKAGLTHVHLLPTFDIASVNEDPAQRREPEPVGDVAPDSELPQANLAAVAADDAFNWGYDPWHYGVPEGSYAVEPNGAARLVEFRRMVAALHEAGLRVVMDVVYNHTHASGQERPSVLDRIVPGYYHRLDENGRVENSTCCQNTATEHRMMQRLMVDDVVHWVVNHGIDGFRFDLMGHHMKADILAVRAALDALTSEEDGVDGRNVWVYGEGWDFGEVQGGRRGVNATQGNLAGTGIGTFNDRIRDAIRGGNPFTDRREQGYATGLYWRPNGRDGSDEVQVLRDVTNLVRAGLAGNLRDLRIAGRRAADLGAYALDPQESIQYASAHDNETLFDKIQLAAPRDASLAERVAMHRFALGVVAVAQGVPFFHAGSELLRSKSMDADSYDSGDRFNRLDFTGRTTAWGVGLPTAAKNRDRWNLMRPLLNDDSLRPGREEILGTAEHFRELLRLRRELPLLRLRTAEDVERRVVFHNAGGAASVPGLIVMGINDVGEGLADLDPDHDRIVVFLNSAPKAVGFGDGRWGRFGYARHPIHASSAARFDRATGIFTLPPRSVTVFVDRQGD